VTTGAPQAECTRCRHLEVISAHVQNAWVQTSDSLAQSEKRLVVRHNRLDWTSASGSGETEPSPCGARVARRSGLSWQGAQLIWITGRGARNCSEIEFHTPATAGRQRGAVFHPLRSAAARRRMPRFELADLGPDDLAAAKRCRPKGAESFGLDAYCSSRRWEGALVATVPTIRASRRDQDVGTSQERLGPTRRATTDGEVDGYLAPRPLSKVGLFEDNPPEEPPCPFVETLAAPISTRTFQRVLGVLAMKREVAADSEAATRAIGDDVSSRGDAAP